MRKLILLFTLLPVLSFGQTTAIPDPNFEQALIDLGLDAAIDGAVITASIDTLTILIIEYKGIIDLTGIEDFTALTCLNCSQNQLTSLDLTQNTALTSLSCSQNQLTSLDLTQNTALIGLYCMFNQLTSLDLTQNTALTWLYCYVNELTCLNVKNGNNLNFSSFDSSINPNLNCVEVDDINYSTTNWSNIDPQTSFSTNCNYPSNCFSTTSILEQTNSISLYPNPTNNLITLDIEGYNGLVNVEVYDLTGKLLQSITNTTISMGEYAKGIYVFKVAYGDRVEKLKVVKE